MTRMDVERRWLDLTRTILPPLAQARGWPISADHCFMRVFLDNACDGRWSDCIDKRPAFRHASDTVLAQAVALAKAVLDGSEDLTRLNTRSLAWRGKAR